MNTEAIIYASQKIYEIEFSKEYLSENNPFNLIPVALDQTVDKWIRELFSNVTFEKIPWSAKGVPSLKTGNTYRFKFSRNACELLDCFGYTDLYGNECNYYGPRNIQLEFNFNKIIGCRPSCFHTSNRLSILNRENENSTLSLAKQNRNEYNINKLKPSHEYVYFDEKIQKCKLGLEQFRHFCLYPNSRGVYKQLEDQYSFYWNELQQNCEITEDYCKAYKGESYSNGDCYLPAGQSVLEFLFGKVIVRDLKLGGYRKIPLPKQNILMKNKVNINSFSNNFKLDTEWKYVPEQYSDTYKYTYLIKDISEQVAQIGYYFGAIALTKIGSKGLKSLAEMIEVSTRNLVEHEVIGTAFHLGFERVTSFITFKAATILASRLAVQGLEIAAEMLNPAMYVIDIISIAGIILDYLPNKYKNIFTKKQMNQVREQFVKKFNSIRGVITNNNDITLLEVLPENIYMRLFGMASALDTSRFSKNYIKSFYYFIDEFHKKVNINKLESLFNENSQYPKFDIHHFNNILNIFKRNMLSETFISQYVNEKYPIGNDSLLYYSKTNITLIAAFVTTATFVGIKFSQIKNRILSSFILPIFMLLLIIFLFKLQCAVICYSRKE